MKLIKLLYFFSIFYFLNAQSWTLNIKAEINLWDTDNLAVDESNYLGIDDLALDEYDVLDVPEPPHLPNNYLTFYFPHPEWNSDFSSNFTQDIRSNSNELYSNTGKTWIGHIYSDAFGETAITIEPDENFPNCNYDITINDIEYNNETIINIYLYNHNIQEVEINVYNCEMLFNEKTANPQALGLQIYPNPFNGRSTIEYKLPQAGFYNINIYNILGKKVLFFQKTNQFYPAGTNNIKINSLNFKSGIYFIKIESNKIIETKKFIVLK